MTDLVLNAFFRGVCFLARAAQPIFHDGHAEYNHGIWGAATCQAQGR
jgi:hypothetical protein